MSLWAPPSICTSLTFFSPIVLSYVSLIITPASKSRMEEGKSFLPLDLCQREEEFVSDVHPYGYKTGFLKLG